jgi:hypothetical protein
MGNPPLMLDIETSTTGQKPIATETNLGTTEGSRPSGMTKVKQQHSSTAKKTRTPQLSHSYTAEQTPSRRTAITFWLHAPEPTTPEKGTSIQPLPLRGDNVPCLHKIVAWGSSLLQHSERRHI